MTIDEARELIKQQEFFIDGTPNCDYLEAKGFILGWNAAVKKSADMVPIVTDSQDFCVISGI